MTICKGCARQIIWAKTVDGKSIPLDKSAPVYTLTSDPQYAGEDAKGELRAVRSQKSFVSHFTVCPERDRFSAAKKKPVQEALFGTLPAPAPRQAYRHGRGCVCAECMR